MKNKLRHIAAGIFLATIAAAHAGPAISAQPQSLTNIVGTTATFNVVASGTEPLAYQWQKSNSVWSDLLGRTDPSLVLTNVQNTDDADYRVVVTNVDGAITSAVAHLTILAPPEITPTSNLQHQAVHIDTPASFVVTASGTPPFSYQWRLDGHDLTGKTDSTLTFSAATPADEGDYTVVVTNEMGAAASEPARLWVVPPPSAYQKANYTNDTFRFPYYYITPTNYNPAQSYPLFFVFHGGYGDEVSFTNGAGGPPGWLGYANYPALKVFSSYQQQVVDPTIVVWPTLRVGDFPWPTQYIQQATNLLDSLLVRFNVDTNRLYVGGLSAGMGPASDFIASRPRFFAGAVLMAGWRGTTPSSSLKEVPLWVFCANNDEYNVVATVRSIIRDIRTVGGRPTYTEYLTGGHLGSVSTAFCTPVFVDWLLGQRRGLANTNEPLLSVVSPALRPVFRTGATNLNLAGSAAAQDRDVLRVSWTNFGNNATGIATGTNLWTVTGAPLQLGKAQIITVVGTTISWAPAFGGNTTFNDAFTVAAYPIQATLVPQGLSVLLSWTGGGPPFCVQQATDLVANDWSDLVPDAMSPVTLPMDGSAGFYRVVGH